ncbi:MAG: YkvA family protein [Usitatibacteraceae bacterium]
MRLIRLLPLLFTRFRKEVVLLWNVLTHGDTPTATKLLALLAVVYVISPIDLIPDFIPIIGWLDDIGVVALLLKLAYKFLPAALFESLRAKVYGHKTKTAANPAVAPNAASARQKRVPITIDVTPSK